MEELCFRVVRSYRRRKLLGLAGPLLGLRGTCYTWSRYPMYFVVYEAARLGLLKDTFVRFASLQTCFVLVMRYSVQRVSIDTYNTHTQSHTHTNNNSTDKGVYTVGLYIT